MIGGAEHSIFQPNRLFALVSDILRCVNQFARRERTREGTIFSVEPLNPPIMIAWSCGYTHPNLYMNRHLCGAAADTTGRCGNARLPPTKNRKLSSRHERLRPPRVCTGTWRCPHVQPKPQNQSGLGRMTRHYL